jgi:molecular chaperone DnaK
LIEEPKAAALAYNFRHNLNRDERIMVFDFGGGTLDITVFHVIEKDANSIKIQVISEGGEAYHGGDNADEMLLAKCYEIIKDKTGQDKDLIAVENQVELITRTREAKERLSGVKSFRIPFTFCIPPFVEPITREQFEGLISDFIGKTRKLVLKALREAYTGALNADAIDRVLLEGGSSNMPWVRDMLIGIFNDAGKIYSSERPALDISLGATYYAAMKMGLLSSPEMDTEKYSVEFETTVPHDIGFEIVNGPRKSFFTMIRRGTPYALAKKSHMFTLAGDTPLDMTELDLRILERIDKEDTAEQCKLIGDVRVTGLPERPSGKTKLKVTLAVEEENGLVRGSVEDLGFGDEYAPSGYKEDFEPRRFNKTVI